MSKLPKSLKKKLCYSGIVSLVLLVTAAAAERIPKVPDYSIERPKAGENPRTEALLAGEKEIALQIGAVEYTDEEIEQLLEKDEKWLKGIVLGENESLESVRTDLVFPGKTEGGGADIYWMTDAPWLVNASGEVFNEELAEAEQVQISAEISYGTEKRVVCFLVTVFEKEYSLEEQELRAIIKELSIKEQESRTDRNFELPKQVQGTAIYRKSGEGPGVSGVLVLTALLLPLIIYYHYIGEQEEQQKKRQETAENSYVEFVTKLSLLMAAGITTRQAVFRMAEEYEKTCGAEYLLTKELKAAKQELENGYSEGVAYEAFGRRMGTLPYQRMTALLSQNSAKGVQGLRGLLLQEAAEVMAQERATIKVKGEQAGTKLLLPMMILLGLVFAILLVPAFTTM